jgi:hypothetical protein
VTSSLTQKIDNRFAALVLDQQPEPNLGITFLDPLDHIADAAARRKTPWGAAILLHCAEKFHLIKPVRTVLKVQGTSLGENAEDVQTRAIGGSFAATFGGHYAPPFCPSS